MTILNSELMRHNRRAIARRVIIWILQTDGKPDPLGRVVPTPPVPPADQ